MMRRVSYCVLATMLLLCGTAAAQETGGFDLSSMKPPPGFLDLSDVFINTDASGVLVATATTRLGNAEALALISASLPGSGGSRRLTIGIKPIQWKITEAIPALSNPVLDQLTFENVALIISNQEITRYAAELEEAEFNFYREVYKSDDFKLVLKPGINLIAAIPAEGLPPNSPLITVMDALGIEKGTILLQGTLGKSLALLGGGGASGGDVIKDLYLRAELPPMRPPSSPAWFRSGQLALELTGEPSVRLVGDINVVLDEDELKFFLAAALARTGASLSGGLIAENGWQEPFGVPWLVLDKVVLALAIGPTGIMPGFAAKMIVGQKDIDVAIALNISPAGVPTGFMFKGESKAGIALPDIADLQARMAAARDGGLKAANDAALTNAISLEALPPIAIKDMGLQFAPKPVPELGVERGFNVKGRLWLPLSADGALTDFAGVDVGVTEDGFWARGDLGAFTLGPLAWQDAKLDLTATREAQHMIVKGEVELFGARQLVDVSLSKTAFSLHTETRLYDMFSADLTAQSVFNLQKPDFQVHAIVGADFGNAVGPMVQQAMVNFTQRSADVIAAAAGAAQVAQQALSKSQAAADELKRVLETQRQSAADNLEAAQQDVARRRDALNTALAARNRAWQVYYATPVLPAITKAERLAAYTSANAVYVQRGVQYNAGAAALAVRQRIFDAIPPVDQNIMMKSADVAVAELRSQLQLAQQRLAEVEAGISEIQDALARGEQLLVIERAEFKGGLQSAMNGQAIMWGVKGSFVGAPFEIQESMDVRNVGESAARMVQALLRK